MQKQIEKVKIKEINKEKNSNWECKAHKDHL